MNQLIEAKRCRMTSSRSAFLSSASVARSTQENGDIQHLSG
ncbi:MAG: hypothetical protein V2J19_00285 [Wenzhouxiangella sp.]|jgi:hypothetical protein|nr:hypothetical protein [Wenzhouxiangella sp.]